jgi:hypothetical protein
MLFRQAVGAPYQCCLFLVAGQLRGLLKRFLCGLVSLGGMFHSLSGEFVTSQVVFFSMVCGGNAMSVRGKLVEFCSSLVRIIRHKCLSE